MSQIINFDNFTKPKSTRRESTTASSCVDLMNSESSETEVDDAFRITLDVLLKNNPDKVLFSLNETAHLLNVGNEFIRRRIKSGKIKATYLGDKPFINIVELARIITEGV